MSNPMDWLQNWYADQCDGDWEHEWGIKIESLDNPGWTIKIDLEGTGLSDRQLPRHKITRSERDWVMAWTSAGAFHAACGPANLTEAVAIFRSWVTE